MSNSKKSFIFIIQTDDDEILAGRQKDVDNAIKECEDLNIDLDFKVIGKIAEPPGSTLPLDFNEQLIEWYNADEKRDSVFMKATINAITKLIA